MIKTQELRIGNLVQLHTGLILKVSDINQSTLIADWEDFGYPSEDMLINPIEISHDIMIGLGFEKPTTYYKKDSDFRFGLDENGLLHCSVGDDKSGILLTACEYVHQLQNLYFALTKTELTLKEI